MSDTKNCAVCGTNLLVLTCESCMRRDAVELSARRQQMRELRAFLPQGQAHELTSLRAEVERLRAKVAKGEVLAKAARALVEQHEEFCDHGALPAADDVRAALAEWEKP